MRKRKELKQNIKSIIADELKNQTEDCNIIKLKIVFTGFVNTGRLTLFTFADKDKLLVMFINIKNPKSTAIIFHEITHYIRYVIAKDTEHSAEFWILYEDLKSKYLGFNMLGLT